MEAAKQTEQQQLAKRDPTSQPLARVQDQTVAMIHAIERAAADPNVDVGKMERLWDMKEKIDARQAEMEFNMAMAEVQAEMRPIAADADNPQTRSKYASYSALDRALRPIYTAGGFALSFDTGDSPLDLHIRILCYVSHHSGHSRTYHIDMPADGKGAKGGDVMTKTHAAGSAVSYGMRYLLKMIFNVAVGEDDDDGNVAGGSVERINTDKVNHIYALINDHGLDKGEFLNWLRNGPIKAASIEDINVNSFPDAMNALKQRLREKGVLPAYPDERFNKNLPEWRRLITSGQKTADQIIGMVSSRARLSDEQIKKIKGEQQ